MEFYLRDETQNAIDSYNNAIDEFISRIAKLKLNTAEVILLQETKKKLHESFYKSRISKLERLVDNIYDRYTEDLEDYISENKLR